MILGHERQINYLEKVRAVGRLAHAYLFHGPEQIGKFTIARALASAMLCEEKSAKITQSCGKCDSCLRIASGTSANIYILARDRSIDGPVEVRKDIPIGDIRELKRRLSYAAQSGVWRVIIIDGVENLSTPAANAFLKLLEEPGDRTLMLLISHSRDLILQTISSRAQPIRFGTISESVLIEFGEKHVSAKEALVLAQASAGRPGRLLSLLANPKEAKEQEKLLEQLVVLKLTRVPDTLVLAASLAKDEERERKSWFLAWEALRRELLEQVLDPARTIKKIHSLDRIGTLRETTNVSPRLALDAMFLEYQK